MRHLVSVRSAVLRPVVVGSVVALALLAGCSSSGSSAPVGAAGSTNPAIDPSLTAAPRASFAPTTITVLAHDSFAVSKDVLAAFTARTGITVKLVTDGDAGVVVNKAILTAGNPEGDVLFGVDNTLLSRALAANMFAPYRSAAFASVRSELQALATGNAVTPVDYGDVCINLDDRYFAAHALTPPKTLDDLTDPKYRDLLVVENPATSSPGLAFLLATVARYGDAGWEGYWGKLKANGVTVANGWTEAYEGEFTAGGKGGKRPIVVSYASSPPAEIVYATDPKPAKPSTSVMTDGCFRQVEFAGVLKGTQHEEAARAFIDFLLSQPFQRDEPFSMFVYPAVVGTPLPDLFVKFAAQPTAPLTVSPAEITAHREAWLDAWTTALAP